ncbi:uncharacterized protein DNG_05007 [Cephalotrichum gorgonifer]|uniref:SET domain-containing protein n=1 Tax=Cephalotrichum gorgonifer TaxID=2041049 RepID=A0AAE8MZ56_9PEZI|nr:uncharacterized protein DNG_05007 [Cephalotrichum gorgonifer]
MSSPLQRKHDSASRNRDSLNSNMRPDRTDPRERHRFEPRLEPARNPTPRHAPPQPPSSHATGPAGQTTPRQHQTPRKLDWTVEKIAEKLREYAKDLVEQHNIMIYRMIGENTKNVKERRVLEGEDLFANVKMPPMPTDKSLTVRLRFKQHSANRRNNNSSLGKRTEILPVIPLKTNVDRVPPYRFHHIEINKSILTPQTRLDYIPHIKDVDASEESRYNRWLQELEEMESASGFDTLTREQRAAKTRRDECTARLALVLPVWLKALSIHGCTKSTLIRYMATQAQSNTITPRQKSSILDTYGRDDQAGSPIASTAAKLFTEAFDRVFYTEQADFASVTLRDVLFRDESVDNIVDPKRSTKDITATPKATEVFGPEKPLLEQGYLETHSLFGCLICFSNSCEHGEYDAKNQKRTFSMEAWGGVERALKRRAIMSTEDDAIPEEKEFYAEHCSDMCFRVFGDGVSAPDKPWSPSELRSLRILVETSQTGPCHRPAECNIAGFLGRPCWAVHRKVREIGVVPKVVTPPTPPRGPVKTLPWYDRWKKMLMGDWQDHTRIYEHARRELVEPCAHDGPCSLEVGCPCVKAGVLCERFCHCTAKICPYKFTGCACHSLGKLCHAKQKERPCICVQLNRECDPALCRGCGAVDRADPANRDDDELHETGCQNCVMQRGKSKQVVIAQSLLNNCGYGLLTAEDIAQDEFVIEYVGELIVHDEGVRREARRGDDVFNEHKNPSYVFALLEDEGIWVDGAVYGNLSRYINHAPDGNLTPKILYVNHEYRIRFTALRDIKAGEELFFNYGDNFPNLTQKLLEDRADEEESLTGRLNSGASSGRGGARKRGRRTGPRRGGASQAAKGRARVQGGRKTAPTETTTEWGFVDPEPSQKRKRTRRKPEGYGEDEEVEDEDEDEVEEEYYPEHAEWQEGSDGEAYGRRRRRGKAQAPKKRTNRVIRGDGGGEEETGAAAAPEETTTTKRTGRTSLGRRGGRRGGPRGGGRGGARGGARAAAAADSEASNSEEDVVVRRRRGRDRQQPQVINDSTDEVETRDEVTVANVKVVVPAASIEAVPTEEEKMDLSPDGERDGEGEDDDEDLSRGRSGRKVQMPARYRDDEKGTPELLE